MKNTIKMSLVAALAVAGLSSTASAGSLEEAIKGVSISGKMEVEYDYSKTQASTSGAESTTTDTWDLDWDVTAKIPVNDMVTAVFGMEGDTDTDVKTQNINSDENKDNVQVTKLYFQYANGPVTAMVGKQGMAGAPWFDDERANGVVGLFNAGPVTLAAAHFTGSNASATANDNNALSTDSVALTNTDITALAAIGKMGPVNAQLWYANLAGIANAANNELNADSIVVMADAQFDIVNVAVKYGTTDYDIPNQTSGEALNDDAEMLQAIVSVGLDAVTLYAGFGATDSKQGGAGLDLTNDTDSAIDFGSEQLSIDDLDNAEAFIIGATVPVGALTLHASYVDGEYDDYTTSTKTGTAYGCDLSEFLVEADYKMSKNFNIGAHYSVAELDTHDGTTKTTTDMDAASVSLEYKF